MLHSINEISSLTGLSKMTIYRKLKNDDLKSHIVMNQGVQSLDDEGLVLLKKMLNMNDDDIINVNDELTNKKNQNNYVITILKQELTSKDTMITELNHNQELLFSMIQEKDKQIQEKDQRIIVLTDRLNQALSQAHELHQNTQVLFKQSTEQQPQNKLLLEEHFKELDSKIMEVAEQLTFKKETNDINYEKKNLFSKIFKKD
jgi:hypothetical protein